MAEEEKNSSGTLSEMVAEVLALAEKELAGLAGRRAASVLNSLEMAWWWAARLDQCHLVPLEALDSGARFPVEDPEDLSDRLADLSGAAKVVWFWFEDQAWPTDIQRREFLACLSHIGDALGMLYRMRDWGEYAPTRGGHTDENGVPVMAEDPADDEDAVGGFKVDLVGGSLGLARRR